MAGRASPTSPTSPASPASRATGRVDRLTYEPLPEPWSRIGADLSVPDCSETLAALGRTTDLGVVAHPDDLELLTIAPIVECFSRDDRWFTGVVCTDGAGAERSGRFASHTDAELAAVRRDEQRRAAEMGGYSAVVQLGFPSPQVRDIGGRSPLVDELARILDATRPFNVYTHDLADRHPTHVAVGLAVIDAIRRMDPDVRPARVVGCEGWRSLDWLPVGEQIHFDVSAGADLAQRLAGIFESQLEGKRYDSAARGRRRSNATLQAIRSADTATEVVLAMELTPLVRNDDLDPITFVTAAIDRFRADVAGRGGERRGSTS